jgi:hypothetical protein
MNRMSKKVEKMLNPLRRDGSGQGALAIVLLLLLMGSVIIVPLLVFMQTGLRAGGVYESKTGEFYAADAGVEDALWQIKNDKLNDLFPGYDPYDFDTNYSYPLADDINNWNVTVNITNIWIPNTDDPDADEAKLIIEAGRLLVTGSGITLGGSRGYQIKLIYYYDTNESSPYYDPNGASLLVDNIGVWLSGGFHYVPGSGSLAAYEPATVLSHCGGEAIVWNVDGFFKDLPGATGYPLTKTVNFQFTGPAAQYPSTLSWVETSGVSASWESDFWLSWDADSKPYRIASRAGNTTAEAYAIKTELRKLGSAVEGDYCAVGNTLMTASGSIRYRNVFYEKASATITSDDISPSATVEAAFLYWSGWIDFHYCHKVSKYTSRWWEIPELKYSYDTTPDKHILINQSARVDKVMFGIEGNMSQVIAEKWQVEENGAGGGWFTPDVEDTWSYACFADVTDQVKGFIAAGEIGANGAAEYTLGHAVKEARPAPYSEYSFTFSDTGASTGYPLGTPARKCGSEWSYQTRYQYAYAGWSLVIIYTSAETKGHQLYAYGIQTDDFAFINGQASHGDERTIDVSGFLAPDDTTGSKLTCFVGEGDSGYTPDYIEVNDIRLSDAVNPANDVWNAYSNALDDPTIEGVDIDTFDMSACIDPGDTMAQITVGSDYDIYNVVYIILSFRSEITTGGTINYLIR